MSGQLVTEKEAQDRCDLLNFIVGTTNNKLTHYYHNVKLSNRVIWCSIRGNPDNAYNSYIFEVLGGAIP